MIKWHNEPDALSNQTLPWDPAEIRVFRNVCYVAYPRSAEAYGDARDSNLGEPGKDINICLKVCLKMFVMLHIPEALRHTVMPWTPAWLNQEKISTFV